MEILKYNFRNYLPYENKFLSILLLILFLIILYISYQLDVIPLLIIFISSLAILFVYNFQKKYDNLDNYPKIDEDNLETGDLVLFSTYECADLVDFLVLKWGSNVIFNNYFTHSGIIIKINDKPYIFESRPRLLYDHLTNTTRKGVVLCDFHESINKYNGNIILCKSLLNEKQKNDILNNYKLFKDLPFTKSWIELALNIEGNNYENGVSCIGLLYDLFRKIDLIDDLKYKKILCFLQFERFISNLKFDTSQRYLIKKI